MRFSSLPGLGATCAIALAAGLAAAAPQQDATGPRQEVVLERTYRLTAREASLDLDGRRAHAEGDAALTYEQEDIEFRADTIDVDLEAQSLAASGNVSVRRGSDRLFADSVEYDLDARTGLLQHAHGSAQGIYFTAENVTAAPRQLVLSNGTFTTCDRPRPDYHVSAREIIVRPGQRLTSRKAAVWYKGRRLLRLPTFNISLAKAERTSPFVPIGGVSRRDGAFAGANYRPLYSQQASLELEARYTTERGIRAFAEGEVRPAWGAVTATVSRRQDLTQWDLGLFAPPSPVRDLTLDRLPEVAVESKAVALGGWGALTGRVAAGQYLEYPTGVRASRAAIDVSLEGRPLPVARELAMRPLAAARAAWYDTGRNRTAVAYGVGFDWKPSANLALRFACLGRDRSGDGPFTFDAIEISRELDLSSAARLGARWRMEMLARGDLGRGKLAALDVAIIHVAHCLEYGVTWRKVGGEFGITIGLAQTGPVEAPKW